MDGKYVDIGTGFCFLRVETLAVSELDGFIFDFIDMCLESLGQVVIRCGDRQGTFEEDIETGNWIWQPQNGPATVWTGQPIHQLLLGE